MPAALNLAHALMLHAGFGKSANSSGETSMRYIMMVELL